jgi:putative transcriptional regulator
MMHHPSHTTIYAAAIGMLPPVLNTLVRAHIARCLPCQTLMQQANDALGETLDELQPAPVAPDAIERVMARRAGHKIIRRPPPITLDWHNLKMRWAAPGLKIRTVYKNDKDALHLLRMKPGSVLPAHTHKGPDMALVVQGSFVRGGVRYVAGDIDEGWTENEHAKTVVCVEQCYLFLATTRGGVTFQGLFGGLVHWLTGI